MFIKVLVDQPAHAWDNDNARLSAGAVADVPQSRALVLLARGEALPAGVQPEHATAFRSGR